jgi:hypothetical protein
MASFRRDRTVSKSMYLHYPLFRLTPISDDDYVELEKECKNMAEVWEDFKSRLPESDRHLDAYSGLPNLSAVRKAVSIASTEWEGKKEKGFGKAKHNFTSFCERLDAHSQLFKIFPEGDKYTSLFTGVLSSIVLVSVRHNEIAEGFSLALAQISSDLKFSQRQNQIFTNPNMKRLVTLLYIKYFQFLCHAMKWYSSSKMRFRKAFNQKFYDDEVAKKVDKIKSIVQEIVQEARLETQQTVIATLETSTAMYDYVQNVPTKADMQVLSEQLSRRMGGMERSFQIADENKNMVERELLEKVDYIYTMLGAFAKQSLVASGESHLIEREQETMALPWRRSPSPAALDDDPIMRIKEAISQESLRPASSELISSTGEMSHMQRVLVTDSKEHPKYTRRQLELDSRALQKYINTSGISAGLTDSGISNLQVAGEIVTRLQAWISGATSQTLWIIGLTSFPAETTNAASYIVTIATKGNIPCVSYFCRFEKSEFLKREDSNGVKVDGLISLLYSLIRQLIMLAPPTLEEPYDCYTGLPLLDGSEKSIPQALDLIKILLTQVPRLLLCVIDGLQMLDQGSTTSYIRQLVDILQANEDGRVRKVLFTTSGIFMSGMKVKFKDRLDCETLPRKLPGKIRPGVRSLGVIHTPPKKD